MTTTLLLDRSTWDLCLTSNGDIALAGEPYSQVQDVASECRLFVGEAWYELSRGIDYFGEILGQFQPAQLLKARLAEASSRVPGVTNPRVFLSGVSDRAVTGQVQFETTSGTQVAAL